jgi:NAD-dependent isocitrate dehydrogenase
MKHRVSLIEGDGIGPEICQSVKLIFEKAKAPIEWENLEAGLGCYEKCGEAITDATLKKLKQNKIALKGPTTTPVGSGHRSINVVIRKALDLFVNVRPSCVFPGITTPFKDVDLIIVRENIEDTYGGIEYRQSEDSAVGLRVATKSGAKRCHEFAFDLAKKLGRKKLACVHKANIMKITDGLWLDTFREVAARFPEIEASDIIVDNCCMQLVKKPSQFDMLVLPNLFGDIVSDLCAGLVGGLGVASGANIGKETAIFEAVHGSAPDIAGKGLANPTAILFSAISMLRFLELKDVADRIEKALRLALQDAKSRTGDLAGQGNTEIFTQKIIENL